MKEDPRELDFHAWTLNTAQRARAGLLTPEELEQIAEELEDMGKSEKRELRSRVAVLLAHLLKWQYQPDQRTYSWEGTIKEQRNDIQELLEENPSLKSEVHNYIEKAYKKGIQKAVQETNMSEKVFPNTFEQTGWTLEQVLDMDYLPDSADS